MRVLSGIQPTGRIHWGNYFGAVQQYIQLQSEEQAYYFIADLHALTTVRKPEELRDNVFDAALTLLGLGLDPNQATLFVQSDVPEISELTWLLLAGTPMGWLERCHAYKDKKDKGLKAGAGLFTYPVLMAADILAYDSDVVPVGKDQVQHIEVARDLASSFNQEFDSEVFVLPKPLVLESTAAVPGLDGQKMSKSYNNTIEVFEDVKPMKKRIMRITTDDRPMEDAIEPEGHLLYELYSLFASPEDRDELASIYRAGNFGYGDVKKKIAEAAESYFAEARERRAEYESNPDRVYEILAAGAIAARATAGEVLARAQDACGIKRKA